MYTLSTVTANYNRSVILVADIVNSTKYNCHAENKAGVETPVKECDVYVIEKGNFYLDVF